jgi:hypothetical protein
MTQIHQSFAHVYACLVHEQRDCVVDLVQNLRALDPESRVILFNGGSNPRLLEALPFSEPQVLVHPGSRPLRWGYLHEFALAAMDLAEQQGGFDAMTIVDSDQLCLRAGYSRFVAEHLRLTPGVGLFGTTSAEEQ